MHRCRREARRRRRAFAGGDGVDAVGIYPIGKSSSTEGQSACGGDDEHMTPLNNRHAAYSTRAAPAHMSSQFTPLAIAVFDQECRGRDVASAVAREFGTQRLPGVQS